MYDLPYHKEADGRVLREFISKHPFAFVTGCGANGQPVATQIPVFFEERDGHQFLCGHLMKNTDHHTAFEHNPNVLVVFTSPNAYVSGSWYSDPHTPSTWNYMSVHVQGTIRFFEGLGLELERILKKTTLHFEGGDGQSPTTFENLPKRLTDRLVHAIVAFEIEVESLNSVFKLSQDRDAESYQRIIQELRNNGEAGRFIADEMEKRADKLFPE
jgi:transcriptional regulator